MYKYLKRIIDFIIALLFMPVLFPVIIILGIIIKLDDGGNVFYCGERLGKDGRIFKMFKFRSMKMNAPDIRNDDGSTFNAENDPRVTGVGRFLRKSSIDELPQMINVLKGDMSLVGPRPMLADKPVSEFDFKRMKRISVRPGITGYGQAYFRNSISMEKKFEYDCYYIDNINFLFDLRIICKTIKSALKQEHVFEKQPVKNQHF